VNTHLANIVKYNVAT